MGHLTRWFNMIIKKRRELRRWQRIVTVLAAIITFATTYALILPAITIEREHTDEVAGMYLEQSADADAMLEENAMEPTDVDMTDTQESEENAPTYSDTAADGEEITAAPKVKTLKSAGKDYTVILTYDEKSGIPDDAVLYVSEIAQDSEEYETYLEEAKKAMGLTEEEALPRCAARFFDIKIMVGNQEFVPESGVSVEITYAEPMAENPETEVSAVHFADEAAEAEVIEASTTNVQDDGAATVEFTAESFSVYGVIYTVDFSWEVNGNLYDVKVTYSDDANIPADAVLKVTEFEEDSDEYTKARDAVLADKQAKGETIDTDDFGFSAMDISIVDKNGNKVEPSAELQVDITIKSLPGVEDLKAVEDNIAIQHHIESNDGVTVDEVFSRGTEEFPDLQMNIQEDPEIHVSFPVASFSTFSVTWQYNGYQNRDVTVHYGYMDGDTFVEFEKQPSPIPGNGFNSTEAYLTYDFDGWQALNQVYYHQNETTNPTTGGTQIQNTLYKGSATANWLYNPRYDSWGTENNDMPPYGTVYVGMIPTVPRTSLIDNTLDNNSHIYVLYEQKPEVTQGGSPVPTNEGAEKPDDPSITKTSDVNHDGTNTIHLTVEGHTSPLKTDRMADVILIFDTSGSMGYRMDAEVDATGTEAPRMKSTKDAAITLIETLLAENQGETGENAKFRIGLVPFSNRAHDTVTLTADEDALKTVIGGYEYQQPYYYWGGYYPGGYTYTGLTPSGGTNWEEALQKANEMSVADDRSTFVIFITDGNPTFRQTRGEYTDAQLGTISTNNNAGQPTTDLSALHAQYNVFGPGSGDWKENADAIEKGDRVSQTGSTGEGRNYAVALEQAKSIVEQNKNFYTLGIGPAVGRLKTLASDAGAPGNYYEATDVDGLNAEMNKIIAQIKGELGYSNVSITDGITPLTQTVQKAGMSDDLPAEDDFVYEKYRPATQEDVAAGTAAAVGEMKWFSWNPEDEGAAPATYNTADGAVEWNLGERFFLEEGVKYRCSFKVWPSQEAYDTIAKLNNGTLDYDSLDARTRAQIAGNNTTGYTLLTNMPNDPDAQAAIGSNVGAGFSYQEATKVGDVVDPVDETDVSDTFIPVSDLDLDKQRITVKKEWLNGLDGRTQDSIRLNVVAQDAPGSQPPFATVSVGSGNTPAWTNSVFISTGLLKVEDGETIIYEQGHDFILTEAEELAYYWELTADTYRPMVITDASKGYDVPTPVLLKKVSSSSTDFDYEIDGGKYQIIPGGGDALKAVNYRRSNLNLTKRVVDKDGETDISDSVKDELFEFTVTVTDKAGKDIWFSVNAVANDESTKIMDLITSATAEVKDGVQTGFYYVASGTPFTVKMKPGWNLRVLNLPSGSTYTIVESDKEGYEYQGAVIDNDGTIDTDSIANGVTGTIDKPNTQYTITATNRMTASSILIRKTNLEGDQTLKGATFKLYKKNDNGKFELFRDTFSVGTAGYSCKGLIAGEYKLEEQTAPPGYIITVKETIFTISENESQVITLADGQTMASVSGTNDDELSVKNEPGAALPNTGGPGTNLIYFLGITLTGLAGAGLVMRKRRKMM